MVGTFLIGLAKGKALNKLQHLRMVLLLGIGLATQAFAEEVYVIAHPDTHITAADVREIFLGEKQFAGTVRIIPVDNLAAQGSFLSKALKMDAGRYSSTWAKKAFRDGLPPPALRSGGDADVNNFVTRTPGAVGYVTSQPSAAVSVIEKY